MTDDPLPLVQPEGASGRASAAADVARAAAPPCILTLSA